VVALGQFMLEGAMTLGGLLVLSNHTLVLRMSVIGNTHNGHQDLFQRNLSTSLRVVDN
jgi:hypothetical protein